MDKDLHLKLTVRLYTDDNQRRLAPALPPSSTGCRNTAPCGRRRPPWGWLTPKPGASSAPPKGSLGAKLLSSTIGGQHGGGAVLTDQAVRSLDAYDAYCADVQAYSQSRFEEAFGFYRELESE